MKSRPKGGKASDSGGEMNHPTRRTEEANFSPVMFGGNPGALSQSAMQYTSSKKSKRGRGNGKNLSLPETPASAQDSSGSGGIVGVNWLQGAIREIIIVAIMIVLSVYRAYQLWVRIIVTVVTAVMTACGLMLGSLPGVSFRIDKRLHMREILQARMQHFPSPSTFDPSFGMCPSASRHVYELAAYLHPCTFSHIIGSLLRFLEIFVAFMYEIAPHRRSKL